MRSMTSTGAESATQPVVWRRRVACLSVLLCAAFTFAAPAAPATAPLPAPLPVDVAFATTASLIDGAITFRIDVMPGHYLYANRFDVSLDGATATELQRNLQSGGKPKQDPQFGRVFVYEKPVTVRYAPKPPRQNPQLELQVTFQGCSEVAGICYPPTQRTFTLAPGLKDVRARELVPVSLKNQFKPQVSQ
jgi:thiol:disulfide interchange protein